MKKAKSVTAPTKVEAALEENKKAMAAKKSAKKDEPKLVIKPGKMTVAEAYELGKKAKADKLTTKDNPFKKESAHRTPWFDGFKGRELKAELPAENKKKLEGETAKAVVRAITEEKDLKYIYPADIDTLDTRKTFRAGVRRKLKAFDKEVEKLQKAVEDKNLKEDKVLLKSKLTEYAAYQKEVLKNPELAS